jgi:hypothetical protein
MTIVSYLDFAVSVCDSRANQISLIDKWPKIEEGTDQTLQAF